MDTLTHTNTHTHSLSLSLTHTPSLWVACLSAKSLEDSPVVGPSGAHREMPNVTTSTVSLVLLHCHDYIDVFTSNAPAGL